MKKNMLKWMVVMLLPFIAITSCEKIDVDQRFTTFGEVFFIADQTASYQAGHLKVKYNGNPIELQSGTGRIRVPEGEGKFEFYDESRDEVLGEKTVNVVPGSPERYSLFQPTEEDPIAFINPDGEIDEEAAPDGFMKIKIANYAKKLIPFEKTDVIVNFRYTQGRQYVYVPVDTIEAVGQTLDTATYRLVRLGERLSNYQPGYFISFKEHGTDNKVNNAGGTMYYSHVAIVPDEVKKVTTRYLTPIEYITNNLFINHEGIYYYVEPKSVY